MSSKINIQNLFHILHPFWIHHTKTWILLSKQYTHLQMAIKHCTKFQVSLISHKGGEVNISYFILFTPLGSTITQRKVIESSCPKICTCTNDNEALQSHLGGEASTSYFTPYTPMDPPKFQKNCWILSFCLYKHLLMIMKHLTKFQVSIIRHLKGEVSTSYFTLSTPLCCRYLLLLCCEGPAVVVAGE